MGDGGEGMGRDGMRWGRGGSEDIGPVDVVEGILWDVKRRKGGKRRREGMRYKGKGQAEPSENERKKGWEGERI